MKVKLTSDELLMTNLINLFMNLVSIPVTQGKGGFSSRNIIIIFITAGLAKVLMCQDNNIIKGFKNTIGL